MPLLLRDAVQARRRFLVGMLVALAALPLFYLAMFPSLQEQMAAFSDDLLPDAMKALIGDADIATAAGYTRSQVFSLTSPLLLTAVAISVGVHLARTEADLTIVATLHTPTTRRRLAGQYLAGVWLVAVAGALAVFVATLLGGQVAGSDAPVVNVLAACVHLALLAGAIGTVAHAASVGTGRPGMGTLAGWGIVAVSFLANSVSELFDSMSWLGNATPWGWYGVGEPISHGLDPVGALALVALAVVAGAVGLVAFDRRDLRA